jgi:hypothetical protein
VRAGTLIAVLAAALLAVASAFAASGKPPQARHKPADMKIAARATLTVIDFPAAWKEQKPTPDTPCGDESKLVETGKAEHDFAAANGTEIDSSAQVFRSTTDANTDWKIATNLALQKACGTATLSKGLPAGTSLKLVSFARSSVPSLAERTASYRAVVLVKTKSQSVKIYADAIGMGRGRTTAGLTFIGIGGPVARADELLLARRIASRLPA